MFKPLIKIDDSLIDKVNVKIDDLVIIQLEEGNKDGLTLPRVGFIYNHGSRFLSLTNTILETSNKYRLGSNMIKNFLNRTENEKLFTLNLDECTNYEKIDYSLKMDNLDKNLVDKMKDISLGDLVLVKEMQYNGYLKTYFRIGFVNDLGSRYINLSNTAIVKSNNKIRHAKFFNSESNERIFNLNLENCCSYIILSKEPQNYAFPHFFKSIIQK